MTRTPLPKLKIHPTSSRLSATVGVMGEFSAFERRQGLCGVPDAVFNPGIGGFVEPEFNPDGLAAHDADGIFDIVLDVELQGDLERMIGEGDRF